VKRIYNQGLGPLSPAPESRPDALKPMASPERFLKRHANGSSFFGVWDSSSPSHCNARRPGRKQYSPPLVTTNRDNPLRREEAAVVHPLRLDELELPPEIGSDKSKHQSSLLAIVFQNSIRKRRSVRCSTTDHPVDANYPRHVCVAWVHPANVRAAGVW